MARRYVWSAEEDRFLIENFCLTNVELANKLGVSDSTIKARYKELEIERPVGKNPLARARTAIYRERLRGTVPDDWFDLPSTRTDAKQVGSNFYWDGQTCARSGHISRRKTSSGGCWECDYGDHKEKLSANADFVKQRKTSFKNWYDKNKEGYLAKQRESKKTPLSRQWQHAYARKKRQEDINWTLTKALRDRLYKAISREIKLASAIKLIGCSIDEVKRHLASQFVDGMSWDNYGEWHIDHVRPCISFDLTDPLQQKECFHYTNLTPLWAFDNRAKGGIWDGVDPRSKPKKRK